MKRTVTIVMELEDKEASQAIWDAHATQTVVMGGRITAIGNGNAFSEIEAYESLLEHITEEVVDWKTEEKIEELEDKYLEPVRTKNLEFWRE